MSSLFKDLQTAWASRIGAAEYFVGPPQIKIIQEDLGDIQNEIDKVVGEIGICAWIVTPRIERGQRPGEALVTLIASVHEDVTINRDATAGTLKPALDVAEQIWCLTEGWRPTEEWTPLEVQSVTMAQAQPVLIYELKATSRTFVGITT